MKQLTSNPVVMLVAVVIGGIILMWAGGQGLYTALTNRQPVVFGCADFLQRVPEQKWLLLKDCRLNIVRASYSRKQVTDTVTQVYIPISGTASVGDTKTKALFATKDQSVIALVTEMRKVNGDGEALKFALTNIDRLFPKRDVQGLVRFGLKMDDRDREKLAALNPNLDPNFIVIDDGEQPEWLLSSAMLLAGLALPIWFRWKTMKSAGAAAPPRPRPVAVAPKPVR